MSDKENSTVEPNLTNRTAQPMRIMWMSNAPYVKTGYGCQTGLFVPRIHQAGYPMAITAYYGLQGGILNMGDIPIYPQFYHPYGQDVMSAHTNHFKADALITLTDTWVIEMNSLYGDFKWCVPAGTLVDMEDGTQKHIENVNVGDRVVSMDTQTLKLKVSSVRHTYKTPSDQAGEVYEITTAGGRHLEVTGENDIAVMEEDGTIKWASASSLVPGDMVYCNSGISSNYRSKRNANETSSTNNQHSDDSQRQVGSKPFINGSGLCRRNNRWRGDNIDFTGDEAQRERSSLYPDAESVCVKYELSPSGVVTGTSNNGNQWTNQAHGKIQECASNRMDASDKRLSVLSLPENNRAVSGHQKDTSPTSYRVYRQPRSKQCDCVQQPIFGTRDRNMAESAGYESQSIVSVSRKGRPYEYVYDITTDDGNFFADGILIHNCPWYPVDHVNMPANVRRNIGQAYARIAMSKFGRDITNASGLDCYYIPHGVDTSIMKPIDKAEARKFLNLPQDKYIMGMVAMNKGNPSRKSFVEILTAFAMFKKVHPDSLFYLHTHKSDHGEAGGINIPELLLNLGLQLGKDVLMPDQYLYMLGYDDTFMANMYSSLDVHVLVSKGEGFGIPILEAQACGTPVIVGDWTAMSELCFSGQKVSMKDADPEYTGIAAYQMKPRVRAIELAMHAEYNKPSPRKLAREKALEYDVNVIMEKYWIPTLKELQEKIYGEREQYVKETQLAQAKAGVA